MRYPTLDEVNKASPYQLLKWHRFLPSPGCDWTERDSVVFYKKLEEETAIMNEINEQLKQAGGITPALSKQVGW